MSIYLRATLASVLLTALVIMGCTEQPLAPQPDQGPAFGEGEIAPDVTPHFTGRDSLFGTMLFGVNFTARVSGEWEQISDDPTCKILEGTGSATHMGRITVDQTICVDGDGNITDNAFSIDGRRNFAEGDLRKISTDPNSTPTLQDGILSGGVAITDTDIQPTTIETIQEIEDGDRWRGWGWIDGELNTDGSFSYEIDGWLHHKQVDVPALEDRFGESSNRPSR